MTATPSYGLKAELQPAMSLEDFPAGGGGGEKLEIKLKLSFSKGWLLS